ncbi:hypothetical protein DC498_01960 [Terrimonas sp.]|nr:hypothetical protein DC498_01960 [Terrimonas sp.]
MSSLNNILRIKQQPYNLLLITGLLFALFSLFSDKRNTLDFHLHDTYFVIAFSHFLGLLAVIPFFIWAIYFFCKKIIYSLKLTWLHTLLTIIMLLIFAFSSLIDNNYPIDPTPKRYYDYSEWNSFKAFSSYTKIIALIFLVFLAAQVILVINLAAGTIKLPRKRD